MLKYDKGRKAVQKNVCKLLMSQEKVQYHYLLRRLQRWKLDLPHGKLIDRACNIANNANKLVAPRMQSAHFSVIFNRACTARRFQNMERCISCKKPHTMDVVEH